MTKRLAVAVLLSGGGTTLRNLLEWERAGRLEARVGLVVSSRPDVRGVEIARDAGVRTEVVDARDYALEREDGAGQGVRRDDGALSAELDRLLVGGGYDLVCMAGFLCRYVFDPALNGRVLNIHPSLIPMFCGRGMYGGRVHRAVVESGVRVTGCTVHLADHQYDTGPIVVQRCCPVYSGDTPEEVAARVFHEECRAYPEAINLFAQGRVRYDGGRRVEVDRDREIGRYGS